MTSLPSSAAWILSYLPSQRPVAMPSTRHRAPSRWRPNAVYRCLLRLASDRLTLI